MSVEYLILMGMTSTVWSHGMQVIGPLLRQNISCIINVFWFRIVLILMKLIVIKEFCICTKCTHAILEVIVIIITVSVMILSWFLKWSSSLVQYPWWYYLDSWSDRHNYYSVRDNIILILEVIVIIITVSVIILSWFLKWLSSLLQCPWWYYLDSWSNHHH